MDISYVHREGREEPFPCVEHLLGSLCLFLHLSHSDSPVVWVSSSCPQRTLNSRSIEPIAQEPSLELGLVYASEKHKSLQLAETHGKDPQILESGRKIRIK